MKSVSISFKSSAPSVYPMNFSARYPSSRFSLCICSFQRSINVSRFSTRAFHAIRYAFISVSSSTWLLKQPITPFTLYRSLHCHTLRSMPVLLRQPFRANTLLHSPQIIFEANGLFSGRWE